MVQRLPIQMTTPYLESGNTKTTLISDTIAKKAILTEVNVPQEPLF